jgi:hypothetical protein
MFKFSIEIITYLLAIYGFIYLTISVVNSIRQRLCSESSRVKMVLMIKNQERNIEGIIRNIYTGDILRKVMSSEKLYILDMGSDDNTVKILRKLKENYGFFEMLDENEKDKVFTALEDNEAVPQDKKADFTC